MAIDIIKTIEEENKKTEIPVIQIGDTVNVHIKVKEREQERIQVFNGIVIGIKGKGINRSFTVRRKSFGIGVERIFPFNAKSIDKVEVLRHGKTRRAKLYYLRTATGKKARLKEVFKTKKKK